MAYDIYFQIVAQTDATWSHLFAFGPKRSIGIKGLQKLVDIFAKYLLTPVGTDPTDLTYGTPLMNLIGSNVDPRDAQEILQLAVSKTVSAIQGYQSSREMPSAERLATATVTAFLLLPAAPGFAAQIYIQNVAGQSLAVVLPTLTT